MIAPTEDPKCIKNSVLEILSILRVGKATVTVVIYVRYRKYGTVMCFPIIFGTVRCRKVLGPSARTLVACLPVRSLALLASILNGMAPIEGLEIRNDLIH